MEVKFNKKTILLEPTIHIGPGGRRVAGGWAR